jgi:hypothetical protein
MAARVYRVSTARDAAAAGRARLVRAARLNSKRSRCCLGRHKGATVPRSACTRRSTTRGRALLAPL